MKSLQQLFSSLPKREKDIFYPSARKIFLQLAQGVDYYKLKGKQLRTDRQLIRFRLGKYRLIFAKNDNGFEPIGLIHRKQLETWLKRNASAYTKGK